MTPLVIAALLASGPKPLVDLPFVHEPGRIWIEVRLNGKPVQAMLDTGASVCVADADAARAAGARGRRLGSADGVGAGTIDTWSASGLRISLEGLPLGADVAYASDLRRMTVGGRRAGALLGGDLLRRYAVEIDYPAGRVRFYDPASYNPPEGLRTVPVRLVDGTPVMRLPLRLPGDEESVVDAMLDTGGTGITLTAAFVRREGLLRRHPEAKPYAGPGGLGGSVSGRALDDVVAYLGGRALTGAALMVTEGGGATGEGAAYDVLLGDEGLRGRLVVLDYGRGRILLGPPRPDVKAPAR